MLDRNTPSDPRLRERRGDLIGRSALLFLLALLLAFAGVAWFLLVFLPGEERPGPSASASPSGSATASPGSPTASTPAATQPASATASVPPTIGEPTAGEPVELVAGEPVGTVTVTAPTYRARLRDQAAGEDQRWAVIDVTIAATAPLDYDAAEWQLEDADGDLHEPATVTPRRPLRSGSLEAGAEATGSIAFRVPAEVDIVRIVVSPAGGDPIGFRVP